MQITEPMTLLTDYILGSGQSLFRGEAEGHNTEPRTNLPETVGIGFPLRRRSGSTGRHLPRILRLSRGIPAPGALEQHRLFHRSR